MSHKVTTTWKGNLQFESDNPNGKTVLWTQRQNTAATILG